MTSIPKTEITADPTSYIDPTGRVFRWKDGIYRAFFRDSAPFYREFLNSDAGRGLIQEGLLVPSEIRADLVLEGFDLVLHHETVPHVSYCFEWPDTMLKDAALLTLELCVRLVDRGILLQDASPYNVFFRGPHPVFIDLGSFVPAYDTYLWGAYQQFCNFFLFPLYLHAAGGHDIARRLLLDCQEGIDAQNLRRSLKFHEKVGLPGYFTRVALPQLINRLWSGSGDRRRVAETSRNLSSKIDMTGFRRSFFKKLKRTVGKIKIKRPTSTWSDYYDETDAGVLTKKQDAVEQILKKLNPDSVLDVGCNTGVFSVMAARNGAATVAFDADHECVSRLYGFAREEGLNIQPLVLNILNPSPGIGWRGIQYSPAESRFKCDMVLALALIHHLIFTGGQDFDRSLESLAAFQKKWLLVEYVDPQDPMARLLPRRPGLDYSWYTLEQFEKALGRRFGSVATIARLSDTRTLILASTS